LFSKYILKLFLGVLYDLENVLIVMWKNLLGQFVVWERFLQWDYINFQLLAFGHHWDGWMQCLPCELGKMACCLLAM
jgi:hypothetical protein